MDFGTQVGDFSKIALVETKEGYSDQHASGNHTTYIKVQNITNDFHLNFKGKLIQVAQKVEKC